jgi:hypothetical protein
MFVPAKDLRNKKAIYEIPVQMAARTACQIKWLNQLYTMVFIEV